MKYIDLFAGIGGFHLGMNQAGNECVGWKYSEQFTREFNCFVQKLPHETAQKRAYMQNLRETSERTPALQQALHQMEKIWESFVSQNQGKRRIRKITPLEAWRLQGFPDWGVLQGTRSRIERQPAV